MMQDDWRTAGRIVRDGALPVLMSQLCSSLHQPTAVQAPLPTGNRDVPSVARATSNAAAGEAASDEAVREGGERDCEFPRDARVAGDKGLGMGPQAQEEAVHELASWLGLLIQRLHAQCHSVSPENLARCAVLSCVLCLSTSAAAHSPSPMQLSTRFPALSSSSHGPSPHAGSYGSATPTACLPHVQARGQPSGSSTCAQTHVLAATAVRACVPRVSEAVPSLVHALPALDPRVQYAVLEVLRSTVLFVVRHSIDADSLVSD